MTDQQEIPVTTKKRQRPARAGGRSGRVAARAQDKQQNPSYAGVSGGTYKPLAEKDVHRIHATALDILEKIGIGDPTPKMLEYALPKGCLLSDKGRLLFPRS
ncbi:MAG: trimethylamine methyltransferase, partial [Gammaproteobacteria bacterium]|nr:trimethylamine methyltransferase [Gammaproteobacteria bacterium]